MKYLRKISLLLIVMSLVGIFLTRAVVINAAALPPIKTVFVILMEGSSLSTVSKYPYISSLQTIGASANSYYKPSQLPNNLMSEEEYIWLEAGNNFGVLDDNDPSSNAQSTTQHLVTLLNNAGVAWKGYAEDISGTNCPLTNSGKYAVRHVPFMFFKDVTNNNSTSSPYCIAHIRPYTELASDLANNTVTGYNFLTPNICNDMHDNCTGDPVKQGDDWLSREIPKIMNSQAYKNGGAIFITWDDSNSSANLPIGMFVLSPYAKIGYHNTIYYDHSSFLRTVQEIFNVSPLLGAASGATNLSDLFTGTINTPTPTLLPTSIPTPTPTAVATLSPIATINPAIYDLNGDGKVDYSDLSQEASYIGTNTTKGDFNGDGKVNAFDFGQILGYLQPRPTITPTSSPTPTSTPVATKIPTPSPIASGNPMPVGQTGNWTMYFNDEFNGSSVDLTKWRPNWLGSSDTSITPPVNSAETSCYDPAQATVANGELDLTAVTRSCLGKSYASGMVESNGKFNFTYGYMEARIWNPAGSGVWPAFWTDGQNWPTDGEIDVMECYGTDASCSYHYHYSGGGPGGNYTVLGSTAGWHTYAADWEPGVITWYYDGVQVWQYTTGIISVPHYIILNLGIQSTSAPIPSTMKVDYLRVWKKS